jgi:hypothetical protein
MRTPQERNSEEQKRKNKKTISPLKEPTAGRRSIFDFGE